MRGTLECIMYRDIEQRNRNTLKGARGARRRRSWVTRQAQHAEISLTLYDMATVGPSPFSFCGTKLERSVRFLRDVSPPTLNSCQSEELPGTSRHGRGRSHRQSIIVHVRQEGARGGCAESTFSRFCDCERRCRRCSGDPHGKPKKWRYEV